MGAAEEVSAVADLFFEGGEDPDEEDCQERAMPVVGASDDGGAFLGRGPEAVSYGLDDEVFEFEQTNADGLPRGS